MTLTPCSDLVKRMAQRPRVPRQGVVAACSLSALYIELQREVVPVRCLWAGRLVRTCRPAKGRGSSL